MSELHAYRITYQTGPAAADFGGFVSRDNVALSVDVLAFTAADAVEQWRRSGCGEELRRLAKIEPLPDAPTPSRPRGITLEECAEVLKTLRDLPRMEVSATAATRASCQGSATIPTGRLDATEPSGAIRELIEALEWCGGSADFGEGGRACEGWARVVQPLLDKYRPAKSATAAARASCQGPETGTARAAAAAGAAEWVLKGDARIEALEAALRERTAERDTLCAQVERQVIALRDGQRDKADLRANIQTIGEERDALQKRIDAAKAWIDSSKGVSPAATLESTRAILERREAKSAKQATSRAGRWRCQRCGAETTVAAGNVADVSKLETPSGTWEWSHHGPGQWMHWCSWGSGASSSKRLEEPKP